MIENARCQMSSFGLASAPTTTTACATAASSRKVSAGRCRTARRSPPTPAHVASILPNHTVGLGGRGGGGRVFPGAGGGIPPPAAAASGPNAPMSDAVGSLRCSGRNVEEKSRFRALRTTAAAVKLIRKICRGNFCTAAPKISDTFSGFASR